MPPILQMSRATVKGTARTVLCSAVICLGCIATIAALWPSSGASTGTVEQQRAPNTTAAPDASNGTAGIYLNASRFEPYSDRAGSVVRLSAEPVRPFILHGEPLSPGHPRYDGYRESRARYPDVRACLSASERDVVRPDLTKLDWRAMRDTADAEICVFRVADSYEGPNELEAWLLHQGFAASEISKTEASHTDGAWLNATWDVKENGTLLRMANLLERFVIARTAYALNITVRYTKSAQIDWVQVGYSYK